MTAEHHGRNPFRDGEPLLSKQRNTIHRKLQKGYSEDLLNTLLQTNWIRTIGWSARTLIAIEIVYQVGFF